MAETGIDPLPQWQPFGPGRMQVQPLKPRLWTTENSRPGSTQRSTDVNLAPDLQSPTSVKMTKRSRFVAPRPDELLTANRGQPPQCKPQHRSRDRRGQQKVAAKWHNAGWSGARRADLRRAGKAGKACLHAARAACSAASLVWSSEVLSTVPPSPPRPPAPSPACRRFRREARARDRHQH